MYDDWPSHGRYVRTLEAGTLIGPVTDFWHGPYFSTIETCACLYINIWQRSSTPYGCSSGVSFASAWPDGGPSTYRTHSTLHDTKSTLNDTNSARIRH